MLALDRECPTSRTLRKQFVLLYVTVLVFCRCDKDHEENQLEEERVYFSLRFIVRHQEKAEQEFKAGTEAKVMEGCC